jgi:hypothetical protein
MYTNGGYSAGGRKIGVKVPQGFWRTEFLRIDQDFEGHATV